MPILMKGRALQYKVAGALRPGPSTNATYSRLFHFTKANNYLRVYTGTAPTTIDYIANGAAFYASNLAYQFVDYNMGWTSGSYSISLAPPPTVSTAPSLVSGTASWFVAGGYADNRIIIGSVGGSASNDPVRLDTTSLSVGVNFTLVAFSLTIKSPAGL